MAVKCCTAVAVVEVCGGYAVAVADLIIVSLILSRSSKWNYIKSNFFCYEAVIIISK